MWNNNCGGNIPDQIQVIQELVCFKVDGGPEIKGFRQETFNHTQGSSTILFFNRADVLKANPIDPNSSTIELTSCCECDCIDCPLTASTQTTSDCAVLRLDATPGSLSAATMNQFTLELLDGPQGNQSVCYAGPTTPFVGSPTVVTSNGGTTIQNFADVINSELGSIGFQAALCRDERVAIQGPAGAGDWAIKISAPGNGDAYELVWDDSAQEFSEIEYASGTQVVVQPGDTVQANGLHPAKSCFNCDPFV